MLGDRLRERRDAIVRRWRELTFATYPEETCRFLATEADRFANPVGHAINQGLDALFDGILSGAAPQTMTGPLEGIVKIRAVQVLGAGEAVGFILLLKEAVAQELPPGSLAPAELIELRDFDGRIDRLLLSAFELFMHDRERVFEIRARELANRSAKLIERLEKGKS